VIVEQYQIIQFVILINLKHFICEFVLQTDEIAVSKLKYGSWPSVLHILHHALGTLVILQLFHVELGLILLLILLEMFLHYHVDWTHMKFGAKSYRNKSYWQWLGAEQFAHQLIYVLLAILVLHFSKLLDIQF
jgi:hypothetical protein